MTKAKITKPNAGMWPVRLVIRREGGEVEEVRDRNHVIYTCKSRRDPYILVRNHEIVPCEYNHRKDRWDAVLILPDGAPNYYAKTGRTKGTAPRVRRISLREKLAEALARAHQAEQRAKSAEAFLKGRRVAA